MNLSFDWVMPAAGVHVILAFEDHRQIGSLRVEVSRPGSTRFRIDKVEVVPEKRRQGVATAMAEHFHERFGECSLYHWDFTSAAGAYWALAMRERHPGWNEISSRHGGIYSRIITAAGPIPRA